MGFRDKVKNVFTKKISPNGLGNPSRFDNTNDAAKLGNTQQGEEHETPQTQRPKVRIEDTPIRELWNVAYEKLREEDGALIAEYEKNLPQGVAAGLRQAHHLKSNMRDQLRTDLEKKME